LGTKFTGSVRHAVKSDGPREWYADLPIGEEPVDYFYYFNDFLNTADYAAADWTITTVEAGAGSATEAIASDEKGGALLITNDDADNDSDSLQLNEETFSLTSGKQTWFQTRLKINDADQTDYFIGLNITDTTPLVTTDRVGFQIDDGNASILCKTEKNNTETSTDSGIDIVDDTYIALAFHWDGVNKVRFFINNSRVATHTTNIPDDENLAVTIHIVNGEAVAKTTTIDYIYSAQER